MSRPLEAVLLSVPLPQRLHLGILHHNLLDDHDHGEDGDDDDGEDDDDDGGDEDDEDDGLFNTA